MVLACGVCVVTSACVIGSRERLDGLGRLRMFSLMTRREAPRRRLRLRVLMPASSRSAALEHLEEQKNRGVNNMQRQSGRGQVLGVASLTFPLESNALVAPSAGLGVAHLPSPTNLRKDKKIWFSHGTRISAASFLSWKLASK